MRDIGAENHGEETLNEPQLSMLRSVALGASVRAAAREAEVSEATLSRSLRRARAVLGAKSTIHAVYIAAKRGLI